MDAVAAVVIGSLGSFERGGMEEVFFGNKCSCLVFVERRLL